MLLYFVRSVLQSLELAYNIVDAFANITATLIMHKLCIIYCIYRLLKLGWVVCGNYIVGQ